MALIICPECGKEYSDFAPACPNCACPTPRPASNASSGDVSNHAQVEKKHVHSSLLVFLVCVAFAAVGIWYAYRVRSYKKGLEATYAGEYATARNYLKNLNYKDSGLILNDISFLEDLEQIAIEKATRDDDNFDFSVDATRSLRRINKYQTMNFHTDELDVALDQYIEGLERIKNASSYESASAVEYEVIAGGYLCDSVIVNLHDSFGFMQNNPEYEIAYSDVLPHEEAFLTAFLEIDEKGHVEVKNGNFWNSSITLFLRNDTGYTFSQAYTFDFYNYNGDKFLENMTTDVLKIAPYSEYTVSIDVPQSARNGYNVSYSYYILDIDIPN